MKKLIPRYAKGDELLSDEELRLKYAHVMGGTKQNSDIDPTTGKRMTPELRALMERSRQSTMLAKKVMLLLNTLYKGLSDFERRDLLNLRNTNSAYKNATVSDYRNKLLREFAANKKLRKATLATGAGVLAMAALPGVATAASQMPGPILVMKTALHAGNKAVKVGKRAYEAYDLYDDTIGNESALFRENGLAKTFRAIGEGNLKKAGVSFLGDLLNLGGEAKYVFKPFKYGGHALESVGNGLIGISDNGVKKFIRDRAKKYALDTMKIGTKGAIGTMVGGTALRTLPYAMGDVEDPNNWLNKSIIKMADAEDGSALGYTRNIVFPALLAVSWLTDEE